MQMNDVRCIISRRLMAALEPAAAAAAAGRRTWHVRAGTHVGCRQADYSLIILTL